MSTLAPYLTYRVPLAIVLAAVVVLVVLSILVARRQWIPTAWTYITHPLTGDDQRISFTKLFDLTIVGVYAIRANAIPASVAIVLVASAHGTKVLMAWITGKTLTDMTAPDAPAPVAPAPTPAPAAPTPEAP